ncbi:MAG: alpha-ketoglutarate decarboxylase [Flavobacteriaceae bacterium]|nr:alpha-ketoglutarate decarboxylase [Flavobacteriaceae bacterium]
MKKGVDFEKKISCLIILSLFISNFSIAQQKQENDSIAKSNTFWQRVGFGGGLGVGIGDGFTSIGVAPSAIYVFNDHTAAGVGLNFNYSTSRDDFKATVVGSSLIGLFKPIDEIILSSEFEMSRVSFKDEILNTSRNYWYPALFLGAGYSVSNFGAIGIRYDVLYNEEDSIYGTALLPFVRVYF